MLEIEGADPFRIHAFRNGARTIGELGRSVEAIAARRDKLDLIGTACQMAKAKGVLVSIDSDAHGALDFDPLQLGIRQARRGWLERADVRNKRSLGSCGRC